jgi:aryl-alcohol dehydrogenase-like predicted oxidoreductase
MLITHTVAKLNNNLCESCRSANHAPEDTLEAIDTSLKDLQLDYLDLYRVIPMLIGYPVNILCCYSCVKIYL